MLLAVRSTQHEERRLYQSRFLTKLPVVHVEQASNKLQILMVKKETYSYFHTSTCNLCGSFLRQFSICFSSICVFQPISDVILP